MRRFRAAVALSEGPMVGMWVWRGGIRIGRPVRNKRGVCLFFTLPDTPVNRILALVMHRAGIIALFPSQGEARNAAREAWVYAVRKGM